jgi:hypothetical protein
MPSKKTSTKTEQVVAPVAPVAPVVEKPVVEKTKKERVKKEVVAPASTVAPVVVAEPPAVTVADTAAPTDVSAVLGFATKLSQLSSQISSLKAEFRLLEKKWANDIKVAQKISSKHKRKEGNRTPSGFVTPTKISDELADFLGKERGTEMARTEVTKEITKYIHTYNLQKEGNGRYIIPDAKLSTLLNIGAEVELTYFNLQRYMRHHFSKKAVATASA